MNPSMKLNYLADDFQPGEHDVVCGRGKKCYAHEGNLNFRRLCDENKDVYTKAKKYDEEARKEVSSSKTSKGSGTKWAREKTSQAFREILFGQYKSSTVSRRKLRQGRKGKQVNVKAEPKTAEAESSSSTDRRHSEPRKEPGFKQFFAEAIRVARQDLEQETQRSVARRESPYETSLNNLEAARSLSEMRSVRYSSSKKRLPMTAPDGGQEHFRTSHPKRYKAMHHMNSSRMEYGADGQLQRPAKWASKLPDIPMSFLLQNGKPLHIDPAALHQACQEYEKRCNSMISSGYWNIYSK